MTKTRHDVFTMTELAECLNVPRSTIYKYKRAKESGLPNQTVGKHWRFNKMVIDE